MRRDVRTLEHSAHNPQRSTGHPSGVAWFGRCPLRSQFRLLELKSSRTTSCHQSRRIESPATTGYIEAAGAAHCPTNMRWVFDMDAVRGRACVSCSLAEMDHEPD